MLCTGCHNVLKFHGNYYVGQGSRPTDFPGTKWISEDPDIWFDVIVTNDDTGQRELQGVLNKDGILMNITLFINPNGTIFIFDASTGKGRIMTGMCNFYPGKLIVEIDKTAVNIFEGKYDTITFKKTA